MSYDKQHRGSADDYAAYFAGMNKSMQQKVALTTAHFPPRGTVADMGSGSGQATFDLANVYSGLTLIGVDVNPVAVAHASKTYQRPNLSYQVGDIAEKIFPDGTLDGILNSSVLHHVTSFVDMQRVETLLDNQVAALKAGGVLIIRDFVIPDGPERVELQLDADDEPWFLRFAKEAQVPFEEVALRKYRLTLRQATEFVLRKDYRDHWAEEILETYTYFTQKQFEHALRSRGMRVVVSVKLWNPWIVQHRFKGKFTLTDLDGRVLPYPPTNYLIVGEKCTGRLVETHRREAPPKFLQMERWSNGAKTYDLVQRPNATVDVLPWFEANGRLYVLAKHGFPRPITQADTGSPDLLGLTGAGYVTEPLAAIGNNVDAGSAALVDAGLAAGPLVTKVLQARAGLQGRFEAVHGASYFTSPGGLSEHVDAYTVRVPAQTEERVVTNYSSFTTSGSVRFLDATQVLRASQVGGMYDARLELNTALLLHAQKRALGPWIGAEIHIGDRQAPVHETLPPLPARKQWTRVEGKPTFLQTRTGTFAEKDGDKTLATARFEYVVPRTLSCNTLSVLPVLRVNGVLCMGFEIRDLPLVHTYTAWAQRLPKDVTTLDAAERLFAGKLTALGGRYYASLGVTPEVVYSYAGEPHEPHVFTWVPLTTDIRDRVRDAHTLIAWLRCLHSQNESFR